MTARVQFGRFEFDSTAGALWRDGVPVRLQPQPALVLSQLVARAGEVVSREDLRNQIWKDGTFVDFERGLNFCVSQIRSALGDSADAPRYVETVPRRGYRFIAPVRLLDPTPPASSNAVPDHPARSVWSNRRLISGAIAAIILAIAGLVIAVSWRSAPDTPVRVAVVPFDNETGDGRFDNVAQGVADATVARLAAPDRLTRVSVIGNSAALRKPRAFRDVKAIGEQVNAAYVVLAQVKRDETRLRLIAHLIRVTDEAHVWASTFDRPAFTLDVQGQIAEEIAREVTARLAPRGETP